MMVIGNVCSNKLALVEFLPKIQGGFLYRKVHQYNLKDKIKPDQTQAKLLYLKQQKRNTTNYECRFILGNTNSNNCNIVALLVKERLNIFFVQQENYKIKKAYNVYS